MNKILVAEDSKVLCIHIKSVLERNEFQVEVANDKEDCLSKVSQFEPDLILMDIMLWKGVNGIDLTKTIKEKDDIPVIYLTALSDKATIESAKHTAPHGFINKPFSDDELINQIEFALSRQGLEKELRENYISLKTTLDSINDSIFLLDESDKVVYMNPTAELMTGHRFSQALHKPISEIIDLRSEDMKPIALPFGSDAKKGESKMAEGLIINKKNGSNRHIGDSRIIPIHNPETNEDRRLIIFRDISERIEKEKMEKEYTLKMQSLLAEEQEMERARQASDLHEGLGQLLSVIKFKVESQKDSSKDEELVSIINQAIQDLTSISEDILPSILMNFNLNTCVEGLCEEVSQQDDKKINYKARDLPKELEVTKKINIYRIIQAALSNAIEHADCDNIEVQLYGYDKYIRITIEDDGKGFEMNGDYQLDKSKIGIRNMISRAESQGGFLRIESDKKLGTVITSQIPVV